MSLQEGPDQGPPEEKDAGAKYSQVLAVQGGSSHAKFIATLLELQLGWMTWFEWDPAKAKSNERKPGVNFDDAMLVFADPLAKFEQDIEDDSGEVRWKAIGLAGNLVVLLVVHVIRERGDEEIVRIISARRATQMERERYEESCA